MLTCFGCLCCLQIDLLCTVCVVEFLFACVLAINVGARHACTNWFHRHCIGCSYLLVEADRLELPILTVLSVSLNRARATTGVPLSISLFALHRLQTRISRDMLVHGGEIAVASGVQCAALPVQACNSVRTTRRVQATCDISDGIFPDSYKQG
jgi:hypothetical protein